MKNLVEILALFFMVSGAFFFLVGTIGLLRMPDVYSKMHATTKCDTLGAGLILLGLIFHNGISTISIKLLLVIIFIWITNPTAAHIIAKADYNQR